MTPLDFLLAALATWYLSYVITQTKGPCDIFARLRRRWPLGGLLTCIYCIAPWLGAMFFAASLTPMAFVVYPFALAGGVAFVYRWTGGGHVE